MGDSVGWRSQIAKGPQWKRLDGEASRWTRLDRSRWTLWTPDGWKRLDGRLGGMEVAESEGPAVEASLHLRVEGLGFRSLGSGFRVSGSGFRVQGLVLRA